MRCALGFAIVGAVMIGSLPSAKAAGPAKIASLEHSLLPLKMHFNLHADQPRVVALLSPS